MQGKLFLTASAAVAVVMTLCAPEAEAQLTVAISIPGLIAGGIAALFGSVKKGSVDVLGTTCSYRARAAVYKWWPGSKATVSCPELGIKKDCKKRRYFQSIPCAVEKVVNQAIQDGKVTAQQAANFFKQ